MWCARKTLVGRTSVRAWAVAVLLCVGAPRAEAARFLVDFGNTATANNATANNDPNNAWNNISSTLGSAAGNSLANLVAADRTPTGLGVTIVSRFNGENTNGTQSSTLYPVNATRDSLFGNTEAFSGLSNIFPSFRLTGLVTGEPYSLSFFASRTGVSDNRETVYTIAGASTTTASLNATNNVDTVATVTGVLPDASGRITISLAPGAANNNANHFTYLNVLDFSGPVPVPEPSSALVAGAGAAACLLWRRRTPVRSNG